MTKVRVKVKKDLGLARYRKNLMKRASGNWRKYLTDVIYKKIIICYSI